MDAYWHLVLDFSPGCFGGGIICHWSILSENFIVLDDGVRSLFYFFDFGVCNNVDSERQNYKKAGVTCGKRER